MDQELCAAIKIGDLEKVKCLVSFGAYIGGKNDYSVKLASSYGHLEMVKYIVSLTADIRCENDLAVHLASIYGHTETVKYLVSIGADNSKITKKHQEYILFSQKMEEKKKERAQKKIYYWWIQICYDPNTNNGKRMLEKSWTEFDKIQKKN